MAFPVGGSGRVKADINVTPMIDVLLVLLIIFMIVVQSDATGFDTKVPQQPKEDGPAALGEVVITVKGDQTVDVNQDTVPIIGLEARLKLVLQTRGDRVIFVRGVTWISSPSRR